MAFEYALIDKDQAFFQGHQLSSDSDTVLLNDTKNDNILIYHNAK